MPTEDAPRTAGEAVAAARRGEHAGWDWLFDRFHAPVRRYAMALLGDASAAEDVAQEVFVAAVSALAGLRNDSEGGVEAWLIRIARNKSVDRTRRFRRETATEGEVAAPDPADVAIGRLDTVRLRDAMEQLSLDQRDVIVRRFVLDQSLEQVAEATGRRVGAVKSLQHRALAALGRYLERLEAAG